MTPLDVTPNIDDAPWRDIDGARSGVLTRICGISEGTSGKLPAVGLAVTLADGETVIAQTTLRLPASAVDALIARHGDPR